MGLITASKLEQVLLHMQTYSIDLLCLQETHQSGSDHFIAQGFLVVYSGTDSGERERAGVGFVVAPWIRHAVIGFTQFNSRLASISIRVQGGSARFVCAYSPNNEHDFDVRADFFSELNAVVNRRGNH